VHEHDTSPKPAPEHEAGIETVSSAYQSVIADLAYLSMPVTAGKRLYALMEKYGVKTKEQLERMRPGALWEEVVLPNIESGRDLAQKIHREKGQALVVPGIFDASGLHWGRNEYMVLWLRLISERMKKIYLADGWEYASGGAAEFVRGAMIHFHFAIREESMTMYDAAARKIDMSSGAMLIARAIEDLRKRGFENPRLTNEFRTLASLAYTLSILAKTDRRRWEIHIGGTQGFSSFWILSAAHSLGVKPAYLLEGLPPL